MSSKSTVCSVLAAWLLLGSSHARADAPGASAVAGQQGPVPAVAEAPEVKRARELFEEGVDLAHRALWLPALAAFGASAEIKPHAVTLYNVAYCERALGHYTRALQAFERALARSNSADPAELPQPMSTAAREYIVELEAQLATLELTVESSRTELLVDGRPLELVGTEHGQPILVAGTKPSGPPEPAPASTFLIRVDPGVHSFLLRAPGGIEKSFTRRFEPEEHADLSIRIAGERRASSAKARRTKPNVVPRSKSGLSPGVVVLGAGGAAVLAGAALGVVAWHKRSALGDDCPAKRCPPDQLSQLDSARAYANASTATLGLGLLAVAAGSVLTFGGVDAPRGSRAAELQKNRPRTASSPIAVELGLAAARLSARF